MPSALAGRTIAVTGANGGIGRHTALTLARAGAHVVLVCRALERAREASAFVRAACPEATISADCGDLAVLAEVRGLAQRLAARHGNLSVLVNNAGVISSRRVLTRDGLELTFAVNHYAPFLLSLLLLETLRKNAPARIVNVNSDSHLSESLDMEDLRGAGRYWPPTAYGRSKLANMIFTREFARRIQPAVVSMNALHPGLVATDFGDVGGIVGFGWRFAKLGGISPEQGAKTPVYVASSVDVAGKSGGYYRHCAQAAPNPLVSDQALAQRLWDYCADVTGLRETG